MQTRCSEAAVGVLAHCGHLGVNGGLLEMPVDNNIIFRQLVPCCVQCSSRVLNLVWRPSYIKREEKLIQLECKL